MKLNQLLQRASVIECRGDEFVDVDYLSHSATDIKPKTLFFCLEGGNADGHEFAAEAVMRGASAIVVSKLLPLNVAQVVVKNTRRAMAVMAQGFYGNPMEELRSIAVTGTNGKTSTCFITAAILEAAGVKSGIIGTNGVYYGGKGYSSELTTPDPIALNRILADMVKNNVNTVVMEASAHAIALNKLDGMTIDVGAFTNLTQDHLDFFGSMEEYGRVKRSFFKSEHIKAAVVNLDDALGARLAVNPLVPTFTYGENNNADVHFACYNENKNGSDYFISMKGGLVKIHSKLSGKFNAYNATAAACACSVLGIEASAIAQGINSTAPIEGRNNVVYVKGIRCVVDFAHTPDGIENILSCIKAQMSNEAQVLTDESFKTSEKRSNGRLIVVFGCGGERDREKRAEMGRAASKYADSIILTEDNSRSEKTEDIISDILKGVTASVRVICDRREAIRAAVKQAEENDVVAVLGKGAENNIIRNGELVPHNDKAFLIEMSMGADS